MAVEVFSQDYAFRPSPFLAHLQEKLAKLKAAKQAGHAKSLARRNEDDIPSDFSDDEGLTPSPYPPFCYRPLHDLESLWWLTAFLLFTWTDEENSREVSDAKEEQRRRAHDQTVNRIFGDSFERRRVITVQGFFLTTLPVLLPRMQRAAWILEEPRAQLVNRFTEAERDYESALNTGFDGLHDGLAKAMRRIRDVLVTATGGNLSASSDTDS